MTEERRKPVWPWIVGLLIGLPVLYCLSLGPWCWCSTHKILPDPMERWRVQSTKTYGAPFNYVYDRAPQPVQQLMQGYIRMWMGE